MILVMAIPLGFRSVKELVIFAVGIGGLVWETVASGESQPGLVAVFAGMVGFPLMTVGKTDAPG